MGVLSLTCSQNAKTPATHSIALKTENDFGEKRLSFLTPPKPPHRWKQKGGHHPVQTLGGVLASHNPGAGPLFRPRDVRTRLRLRTMESGDRRLAGPFSEFLITHPPPTHAHLPQLQPLGHGLQALLPRAFHRQCALDDIAVQQADPGDKAVLTQDVVAPCPAELQAERHDSVAPRHLPPFLVPPAEMASAVSGLGDGATSCAPPDTERGGHARCGTLQDGCKQKSSRKVISWKGRDGSHGPVFHTQSKALAPLPLPDR